jgi:hypothetical protein
MHTKAFLNNRSIPKVFKVIMHLFGDLTFSVILFGESTNIADPRMAVRFIYFALNKEA